MQPESTNMTMTKMTTTGWDLIEVSAAFGIIESVREPWIAAAVAAGKTDGIATELGPLIRTRVWIDNAAAQEWATFITELAAANGHTVTVTISDI